MKKRQNAKLPENMITETVFLVPLSGTCGVVSYSEYLKNQKKWD